MFEVRDRATGRRLDTFRDEWDARVDVAARLDAAGRDRLIELDRFEVWSGDDEGTMRSLGGGRAMASWVAFGSDRNPAETVTETRLATDDELAFLKRRQSSLGVEVVIYCCGAAAITFLFCTILGLLLGGIGIGALLGLIAAIFIVGSGFAIAWGKRYDLRLAARSGTVTIKRGPFRAFSPLPRISHGGTLRSGGGANADTYYAEFADTVVQVDMSVGSRLERLGPVLNATVLLVPRVGQILEVLGTDGTLLYRHEDFWHTSFRAAGGDAPIVKDEPASEP